MKKKITLLVLIIILMSVILFKLFKKEEQTQFQNQYQEYMTKIGNKLTTKELPDSLIIEAQNIFKPNFYGEYLNTALINQMGLSNTQKEHMRSILIFSFFKLKLAEIKRQKEKNIISDKEVFIKIKEFDKAFEYLVKNEFPIISKDNPLNDYSYDMSSTEYIEKLKEDLGLDQ